MSVNIDSGVVGGNLFCRRKLCKYLHKTLSAHSCSVELMVKLQTTVLIFSRSSSVQYAPTINRIFIAIDNVFVYLVFLHSKLHPVILVVTKISINNCVISNNIKNCWFSSWFRFNQALLENSSCDIICVKLISFSGAILGYYLRGCGIPMAPV